MKKICLIMCMVLSLSLLLTFTACKNLEDAVSEVEQALTENDSNIEDGQNEIVEENSTVFDDGSNDVTESEIDDHISINASELFSMTVAEGWKKNATDGAVIYTVDGIDVNLNVLCEDIADDKALTASDYCDKAMKIIKTEYTGFVALNTGSNKKIGEYSGYTVAFNINVDGVKERFNQYVVIANEKIFVITYMISDLISLDIRTKYNGEVEEMLSTFTIFNYTEASDLIDALNDLSGLTELNVNLN